MTNFKPRLLQIKGKIRVRIFTVDTYWKSLNHGDSFVLDLGRKLILWRGNESNRWENIAALHFMRRVRENDRGSNAVLIALGSDDIDSKKDTELFWKLLLAENNKEPSNIKSSKEGGVDDSIDKSSDIKFFQIEGEKNYWSLKVLSNNLHRLDLKMENIYLLCSNGIAYIWIGKKVLFEVKQYWVELVDWFDKTE